MVSNDFTNIFWLIGQAVLQGIDPYTVQGNVYPPAANYFFVFFAMLPAQISFPIWVGTNVLIILFVLYQQNQGKKSLIWLGFTPVLFVLASGQIDLIFLAFSTFLEKEGWKPVVAAVLITLKPQIAFVLLPWVLIRWLLQNRPQLIRWVAFTILLHLSPLLLDPMIYRRWWFASIKVSNSYILNSPGIFGLRTVDLPILILVPIAVSLFLFGLVLNRKASIVTNLLALPIGTWYNMVLLVGIGPGIWMVILSWLAFGLAFLLKGSYPFILIPLAAFYFVMKDEENRNFRSKIVSIRNYFLKQKTV